MDGDAYGAYGEIWSYNLQRLDELQEELTRLLKELEDHYSEFDSCYSRIHEIMEVICSLYSSNNTLDGKKQVLSLMSVIESYRNRYTGDGVDFQLIYGLLAKIERLRDAGYENFPVLHHQIGTLGIDRPSIELPVVCMDTPPDDESTATASPDRPYRWITFQRNGSHFIVRYNTADIIAFDGATVEETGRSDRITIRAGETTWDLVDCIAATGKKPESVNYCVVVDGPIAYAAHSVGKRIYAKKDFISPLIKPFKTVGESTLSSGRVRLFGKNHIVLKNQYADSAIMS